MEEVDMEIKVEDDAEFVLNPKVVGFGCRLMIIDECSKEEDDLIL